LRCAAQDAFVTDEAVARYREVLASTPFNTDVIGTGLAIVARVIDTLAIAVDADVLLGAWVNVIALDPGLRQMLTEATGAGICCAGVVVVCALSPIFGGRWNLRIGGIADVATARNRLAQPVADIVNEAGSVGEGPLGVLLVREAFQTLELSMFVAGVVTLPFNRAFSRRRYGHAFVHFVVTLPFTAGCFMF
jgi:hypothetical protein